MPTADKELIEYIIQKQATVLGLSVAIRRARNVPGIVIDDKGAVTTMPEGDTAIPLLLDEYKKLSGNMGVQLCKQAAAQWAGAHPGEKLQPILQ